MPNPAWSNRLALVPQKPLTDTAMRTIFLLVVTLILVKFFLPDVGSTLTNILNKLLGALTALAQQLPAAAGA